MHSTLCSSPPFCTLCPLALSFLLLLLPPSPPLPCQAVRQNQSKSSRPASVGQILSITRSSDQAAARLLSPSQVLCNTSQASSQRQTHTACTATQQLGGLSKGGGRKRGTKQRLLPPSLLHCQRLFPYSKLQQQRGVAGWLEHCVLLAPSASSRDSQLLPPSPSKMLICSSNKDREQDNDVASEQRGRKTFPVSQRSQGAGRELPADEDGDTPNCIWLAG